MDAGAPKRVAWGTDLHFDLNVPGMQQAFVEEVRACAPDALLITGDIANAHTWVDCLLGLHRAVPIPIYYVLGNHDFYLGSFGKVRALAHDLARREPECQWLGMNGPVALSDRAGLVGCNGWGDGRAGAGAESEVELNDGLLIQDLVGLDTAQRFDRLHELGDAAAAHLNRVLPQALDRFERVIVATHVPPFPEACLHDGHRSEPEWLPHFTCVAVGEAIVRASECHPDRRIQVLCGHTHCECLLRVNGNVEVRAGAAQYGQAHLSGVLTV